MAADYLDLKSLQAMIKEGLEDLFPEKFWVKAEIGQWSPRANGHCYLSLQQSDGKGVVAEMKAMIWKWNVLPLTAFFEEGTGSPLRSGITVLVKVEVNYNPIYGISLFIDDIDPSFTLGEQALERKRTMERLEKEGLTLLQKELCLPDIPYRLAVVSSRTAAGFEDFCKHLEGNACGYVFKVVLFEAAMQGADAPASVASAVSEAGAGDFDAILVLRGGGSALDLSCFDDYCLAAALARCPLPVLTAIGHEKDFHAADLVAHAYFKTPTALADWFISLYMAQDERITGLFSRVKAGFSRRLSTMESAVERIIDGMKWALSSRLSKEESRISVLEAGILGADPAKILSRGYVLVTGKDGRMLRSVSGAAPGDEITVCFADGRVIAEVKKGISNK